MKQDKQESSVTNSSDVVEDVIITPNLCIMSMMRSADNTSKEVRVSCSWSGETGSSRWAAKTPILQLWSHTVWHTLRRRVQRLPRWANTWQYTPRVFSGTPDGTGTFSDIQWGSSGFIICLIKQVNHEFWTLSICTGAWLIWVCGSLSGSVNNTMALLRCNAALLNNSAQFCLLICCSAVSSSSLLSDTESSTRSTRRKNRLAGLFFFSCDVL